MPAVTRIGDVTTGHGCFPPTTIISSASPSEFVDGLAIARVGDRILPHTCGKNTHDGVVAAGSTSYQSDGVAVAFIGAPISCGDFCGTGSPTMEVSE